MGQEELKQRTRNFALRIIGLSCCDPGVERTTAPIPHSAITIPQCIRGGIDNGKNTDCR